MNKPIDTVKDGQLNVSVWDNLRQNKQTGQMFNMLSVSIQRSVWNEAEKKYVNYNSFSIIDLPKIADMLIQVYSKYTKMPKEWKELKIEQQKIAVDNK